MTITSNVPAATEFRTCAGRSKQKWIMYGTNMRGMRTTQVYWAAYCFVQLFFRVTTDTCIAGSYHLVQRGSEHRHNVSCWS